MFGTRRRILQAVVLWPVARIVRGAGRDFWENKDPASWSEEEKRILLGQSPWAQEGMLRFEVERKGPSKPYKGIPRPGDGVPGARPGDRPGAVTSVPIGEAPPPVPRPDTGRPVQFPVLARWETAKPVRLAGGPELPAGTERFYVIRLVGMPLLPAKEAAPLLPPKDGDREGAANPNQTMLEEIKASSRIVRKDRTDIPCAHLLTGSGDSATQLLLFFERGSDSITVREKAVTLESRFGPFHLSIKFPLKDMMFNGALAL